MGEIVANVVVAGIGIDMVHFPRRRGDHTGDIALHEIAEKSARFFGRREPASLAVMRYCAAMNNAQLESPVPTTPLPRSVPPSASQTRQGREEGRTRDIARAQGVLRGGEPSPQESYDLAGRLKDVNEFGYARKLLGRIFDAKSCQGLTVSQAKVGQQFSLCTYKDPDLPAEDRFKKACEILDEVDALNLTIAERQESFGLRGAIYKRMWQVEGQAADLVRSLDFYLKGYDLGPQLDRGYTGINAAFVLDLLCRWHVECAANVEAAAELADLRWSRAQEIRRSIVATLTAALASDSTPADLWWVESTLAEAYIGLGQYDDALAALRAYNRTMNVPSSEPPVDLVSPWVLESTITQLGALAEVQADIADRLYQLPLWKHRWPAEPRELRACAETTLRKYLGRFCPGIDRAVTGKVGLALSGGGFRASLFHIGVLACLAERDVLRRVEVLSCVSGGSIVGTHYYLLVQQLLQNRSEHASGADPAISAQDYVALVQTLAKDFLEGISSNIRCRVFGSLLANLRAFFQPSYTTTRRLGELYEKLIYAKVPRPPKDAGKPRRLPELLVQPKDEGPLFKPKYDNWRRAAKVPTLVLNAATLNTGHNWQFTASWMGEPPSALDEEIAGNYRLRRMYYGEAPFLLSRWKMALLRPFAPPDYQNFRLGDAVAASSCVPGLFEPLVLPDLYDGKTVRLVDGGVYDNQGVASLLEQDCTLLIVSDGSGQMNAEDHPGAGRLGVPMRSFDISMARVRQSQYRELSARRRAGLLKGFMFLHLKKDLHADPVDWRDCQDPFKAADDAIPAASRGTATPYFVPRDVQGLLAAMRTDLDSFTEVEAFSLMSSGYAMAEANFGNLRFPPAEAPSEGWAFNEIKTFFAANTPGNASLKEQLQVGRMSAGKIWFLARPLLLLAVVLAAGALYALYRVWIAYGNRSLLTVGDLYLTALSMLAALFVPKLVLRLVQYRQTIETLSIKGALAVVAALGFKVHLLFFDPLFRRMGRLKRLRRMNGDSSPAAES
jgi:predicted acylesterase/phospholipase RssA